MLLAMPKCASTALAQALTGPAVLTHQDLGIEKHLPLRAYRRDLRTDLETCANGPLETVCLIREPEDWLFSWWRYRARPGVPDPANSTAGMSFDAFVQHYLTNHLGPSRVGRQARFVSDGTIEADQIFAYERIDQALAWLSARLGRQLTLGQANVSPPAPPDLATELSPATRTRLQTECARDFEIHSKALSR